MTLVSPGESLQDVFDAARPGDVIQLPPGDWRVKSTILTTGLTVAGAGAERTRILWDDYAKKLDENGVEYNTFRTWTLAVCADGVAMEDLLAANPGIKNPNFIRTGEQVVIPC